jgi:hypothetical protein
MQMQGYEPMELLWICYKWKGSNYITVAVSVLIDKFENILMFDTAMEAGAIQ